MASQVDIVRMALDAGAEADAPALAAAMDGCESAAVHILLDRWAGMDGLAELLPRLLRFAVEEEDMPLLRRLLLDLLLPLDVQDDMGMTALHIAAEKGHLEACELLLEAGARCDLTSFGGETPLQLARFFRHTDCARLLKGQSLL